MYIVFLRFSTHRAQAREHMAAHATWIQRGIDEGVFLLTGSLSPQRGGFVVARAATREELEARIHDDPFVAHGVVEADIIEVAPSKADPRLAFLLT